jgi:hypothetical protein
MIRYLATVTATYRVAGPVEIRAAMDSDGEFTLPGETIACEDFKPLMQRGVPED